MAYRLGSPASIAAAEKDVLAAEERLHRQEMELRKLARHGGKQGVDEARQLVAVLTKTLEAAHRYLRMEQAAAKRELAAPTEIPKHGESPYKGV